MFKSLGELILGQENDGNGDTSVPAPQTIDVEDVIRHENWRPNNFKAGNDIALVRLEKSAILSWVKTVLLVKRYKIKYCK